MAHINLRDNEADGSDLSIICDSSLNPFVRMSLAPEDVPLVAPEDKTIKTLYVCGRIILEKDKFGAYGEIESIRILAKECIAFVTYTTREGAENAALELTEWLDINGQRLKLGWVIPVPVSLSQKQKQKDLDRDSSNQQGTVSLYQKQKQKRMDLLRRGALMSTQKFVVSASVNHTHMHQRTGKPKLKFSDLCISYIMSYLKT